MNCGVRHPFRVACRSLPCIVHFEGSYRWHEDSSVTTPAHFVPASQLARGARSEEVVAKHKKYLWPSVTNYFQQPLVADRGEMQHLWDLEGNKYLDFFGGILTVTAHAAYRKGGVISVGISHAVNPYCYRCPLHLKYPDCEVACAEDVENLIQTGTSGNIAAFMAEPIQGVGGFITPPKEYFKIVFKIVKKYGALFIADEVQTGWGRTGKKWFGIEQWEVIPDMITSAKGMGNGVPVGLTVTTPEIAGGFQGMNIATFGGNPVTSVAAKATIELIEEENLLENAHVVGSYFRGKLEELQAKHSLIGDVRGMGLMQALELVKDRKTKEPAPEAATQVMERARQNGLLIGKGGLYGNTIRMAPMLNTTKPDVDEAIKLLDKSFSEVRN